MNAAHWHLVVNHFPIIVPIIALFVMVGGIVFKSDILKKTAYLLFILAAILTLFAFNTGEEAEEIVEEMGNISHDIIHEHEEVAETFSIMMYVLGGISLIGFWANWKQKSFAGIIVIVTLVFSVVTLFYAQKTGTSGGEIRHTEIRADFSAEHEEQEEAEYDDD